MAYIIVLASITDRFDKILELAVAIPEPYSLRYSLRSVYTAGRILLRDAAIY